MARRKSSKDLHDQMHRIRNLNTEIAIRRYGHADVRNTSQTTNGRRVKRAESALARYGNNMMNHQFARGKGLGANDKFSRRVYMGLANG